MRDLLGVILSVALPWVAGTLWVRALWRGEPDQQGAPSVGYGYLVGAFATTLVLRLVDAAGQRWSLAWIALPLLALAGAGWFAAGPHLSPRAAWRRFAGTLAGMPPPSRAIFWLFLALCAINAVAIAAHVAWSLLLPYDVMAQWADKARVWYEYGRLLPFVRGSEWLSFADPLQFSDMNPAYPGTVPLLQVWTALALGRWDESLINAPWVAAFVALGFAFYGQARRLGAGPAKAMVGAYLLLSLPFLEIHVAVAGMVDIFIAIAYGLAAISLWQWTLTRRWQDAALALVMAILGAMVKNEGILWALTLVPAIIVALRRRVGLALVAFIGSAVILYLLFGPPEVRLMGYVLRTRLENVTLPVYQHLFVMDNWHLFWYAAIAVIAVNGRLLLGATLAPMTVTMLGAVGFVMVVFYFSSAAAGVDEESLLNRFLLQFVPALAFYLLLILRERERAGLGGEIAPATAAAGPTA
jgi:hypothetical protein